MEQEALKKEEISLTELLEQEGVVLIEDYDQDKRNLERYGALVLFPQKTKKLVGSMVAPVEHMLTRNCHTVLADTVEHIASPTCLMMRSHNVLKYQDTNRLCKVLAYPHAVLARKQCLLAYFENNHVYIVRPKISLAVYHEEFPVDKEPLFAADDRSIAWLTVGPKKTIGGNAQLMMYEEDEQESQKEGFSCFVQRKVTVKLPEDVHQLCWNNTINGQTIACINRTQLVIKEFAVKTLVGLREISSKICIMPEGESLEAMAFINNGSHLAAAMPKSVCILDISADPRRIKKIDIEPNWDSFGASPCGRFLAIAYGNGVSVCDVEAQKVCVQYTCSESKAKRHLTVTDQAQVFFGDHVCCMLDTNALLVLRALHKVCMYPAYVSLRKKITEEIDFGDLLQKNQHDSNVQAFEEMHEQKCSHLNQIEQSEPFKQSDSLVQKLLQRTINYEKAYKKKEPRFQRDQPLIFQQPYIQYAQQEPTDSKE